MRLKNNKEIQNAKSFSIYYNAMIIFDKLWVLMKKKGVSTYQLRERCGIDSKTIRRLRANENMETKTLDKLCTALDCRLEDIAEYRKDGPVL